MAGAIVDFELIAPLEYKLLSCEGLRFRVVFKGTAVASGLCRSVEGPDYTYARDTVVEGEILGELPSDALMTEGFEGIIDSTLLEVVFSALHLDDRNPTEGPPEKFAGEA